MPADIGKIKIGILGGGQLGRMIIQEGISWNLSFFILDPDPEAPCKNICDSFTAGSLIDFETVYQFGKGKDILTIEIENVNTEALSKLEQEGVKVFPQPHIIKLIQDKREQKQFYQKNHFPTSDFKLIESKEELKKHRDFLPAFQKLGKAGYDGRGVQRLSSEKDFDKAFNEPSLIEKAVDFEKELSVIVSRNEQGEVVSYPVCEMVFHPVHNLVEYQFSPAEVSKLIETEARKLAEELIVKLGMVGLLAVEMFLTKDGKILINEIAPRPHNSGHHTIEGHVTSQFQQHLRSILGMPLGKTDVRQYSGMVNLLGEAGYTGQAKYEGLEKVLGLEGVFVHLYGKKVTKPFRKMGHVTIIGSRVEELKRKADFIKENLKIIA